MKTKIFKTGLPIMAFLMAIAFAFATENKVEEETALVTGYIIQNGCKENSTVCNNVPSETCTTGLSQIVYKAGTGCMERLFHTTVN